ncbi:Gfo/Idh/MocA family oxidoreductase [Rhodophyticola sp. CCM32]|uniref:Gfo/Idh/MocA family protein n=1 Tax=Rhodophyticola sp. CCM32 TaxID=2916397 RepID=UPI00107EFB06|nr:Gfo/Idh/MocA family oxidoreductase [Rhodophyticola sp. CCM32]QBY01300.1 Gfo/Idh/MocA family oxidoreductase [Rhodophyticola sp. CCM32]
MKAIVFGTGSIGRRHIGSLRQIVPDCEIIIVRNGAHEDDYSKQIGAIVIGSPKAALDLRPDLAVIATPSALHIDALAPCMMTNLPIYLEKPAVTTNSDISSISQLIANRGYDAPSQMGCNLRYLPAMQKTYDLARSGELGLIARASFQAGQYLPDWRPGTDCRLSYSADPKRGGGVIFDLIHEIDAACFLLGAFTDLHAFSARMEPLGIRSEAVATLILRGETGKPLVTIGLDYVSRQPLRKYDIVGTAGTLQLDLVKKRMILDTAKGREILSQDPADFDVAQTYVTAMSEFLNAISTRQSTSQDISVGLETAALAIKAKAAL